MTWIAVPITVQSVSGALTLAAQAGEAGADLVEYRMDSFTDAQAMVEIVERSPLPCIVTCRMAEEGGDFEGTDEQRADILAEICRAKITPTYIDIELAAYERSAALRACLPVGENAPRLILSTHDFRQRPADLMQRFAAMSETDACHVAKLAWHARSLRCNLEAFDLLRERTKPTIALCMGEQGMPSRVLAKKFGALLTFASLKNMSVTAPGQPTIRELKKLYRWDAIDRQTQIFGVIGHPVAHSLSPAIHNAGFDAVDYNGVYLPMRIEPDYVHFKATVVSWLDFAALDFRGASVTIPHKENLLRFVEEFGGEIEPLARRIGAANTLTVRDDGSLYASNTDYAAALDSVCDTLGIEPQDLRGRRVAVIGAGGAARAIVAGFAWHGAAVTIYNRTLEKAQQLVQTLTEALRNTSMAETDRPVEGEHGLITAAPMHTLRSSDCEIFINCTPVGMHPDVDASPIDPHWMQQASTWSSDTVVFDTIYNPATTRLLADARRHGCRTISGIEMFIRQAAVQFELWTGRQAPLDVFRAVVERSLHESSAP